MNYAYYRAISLSFYLAGYGMSTEQMESHLSLPQRIIFWMENAAIAFKKQSNDLPATEEYFSKTLQRAILDGKYSPTKSVEYKGELTSPLHVAHEIAQIDPVLSGFEKKLEEHFSDDISISNSFIEPDDQPVKLKFIESIKSIPSKKLENDAVNYDYQSLLDRAFEDGDNDSQVFPVKKNHLDY